MIKGDLLQNVKAMSRCILFLGILFILQVSHSCVSSKQFNEVQNENQKLRDERDILKAENEKLSVANTEMTSRLKKREDEVSQLTKKLEQKEDELETINKNYQLLNRGYFELQQAQEELMKGNNRETRRLLRQLQETQADLQAREDELRGIEKSLDSRKRDLEEMQYEVQKRNERLAELESALQEKDAMMAELKDKVSNALLGFENNGLTITQRNGMVYVSMEEKLLFQTGSYAVDPRGVQALRNLSRVLERNTDIHIMVEGHTDNVPYRSSGGHIQDNWDLSVKRATSIVRILLENSSIDPKRITASGRGEFYPIEPNTTAEARQKNRRTEIILTPDLEKLYQILQSY